MRPRAGAGRRGRSPGKGWTSGCSTGPGASLGERPGRHRRGGGTGRSRTGHATAGRGRAGGQDRLEGRGEHARNAAGGGGGPREQRRVAPGAGSAGRARRPGIGRGKEAEQRGPGCRREQVLGSDRPGREASVPGGEDRGPALAAAARERVAGRGRADGLRGDTGVGGLAEAGEQLPALQAGPGDGPGVAAEGGPGERSIGRYAEGCGRGFQPRRAAERFRQALGERLARLGGEQHPEKTRLLEGGRYAEANRRARGLGKPETCEFRGCPH